MTPSGRRRMPFDAEPSLADQIEDFRHENRISTTAGAVRDLVQLGLKAKQPVVESQAVAPCPEPQEFGYRPLVDRVPVRENLGNKPNPDAIWPSENALKSRDSYQFNLRIAAAVVDQLKYLSERTGLTVKDIVETALCDCLDRELPLVGKKRAGWSMASQPAIPVTRKARRPRPAKNGEFSDLTTSAT